MRGRWVVGRLGGHHFGPVLPDEHHLLEDGAVRTFNTGTLDTKRHAGDDGRLVVLEEPGKLETQTEPVAECIEFAPTTTTRLSRLAKDFHAG